jgi:hypothetical protein
MVVTDMHLVTGAHGTDSGPCALQPRLAQALSDNTSSFTHILNQDMFFVNGSTIH